MPSLLAPRHDAKSPFVARDITTIRPQLASSEIFQNTSSFWSTQYITAGYKRKLINKKNGIFKIDEDYWNWQLEIPDLTFSKIRWNHSIHHVAHSITCRLKQR